MKIDVSWLYSNRSFDALRKPKQETLDYVHAQNDLDYSWEEEWFDLPRKDQSAVNI